MEFMSSLGKGKVESQGMPFEPSGLILVWPFLDEDSNFEKLWTWDAGE